MGKDRSKEYQDIVFWFSGLTVLIGLNGLETLTR